MTRLTATDFETMEIMACWPSISKQLYLIGVIGRLQSFLRSCFAATPMQSVDTWISNPTPSARIFFFLFIGYVVAVTCEVLVFS